MAREQGVRYLHIFYDDGPADAREPWREGAQTHEFRRGAECWCEPKAVKVGKTVFVVHDPENGLTIIEDTYSAGTPPNPERS